MSCTAFRDGWTIGGPEGHAASCPACAEWMTDQRRAAAALAQLGAELDAALPPADREDALRAAFRQLQRRSLERPRGAGRWLWPLAAAAVVLIAVVLARGRGAAPAVPALPVAAAPEPSSAGPSPGALAPRAVVAARSPASSPRPRHAAASEKAPVAGEPAPPSVAAADVEPLLTGPVLEPVRGVPARLVEGSDADDAFYALVPGPDVSLESGQIVRVKLRPEALRAAGLASPMAGREPVEADVLVGPDGVARGIRIVRPRP